jgi:hypothetical protein
MNRGTAMLLAPHATRLNALMAVSPVRAIVLAAVCILVVLLASAVVMHCQRRRTS